MPVVVRIDWDALTLAQTKIRDAYLRGTPVKDTPANRQDAFAPRFWEARLEQPLRWREPRRVFVNSMSDVFHATSRWMSSYNRKRLRDVRGCKRSCLNGWARRCDS